jgi:phosphatidylglycerol:prolipoprotein diacylglycerol transferase
MSVQAVYNLSLILLSSVLIGGRLVEVLFYEWDFYRHHLSLIPAYWIGGMATHGLLLGGTVGLWIFCRTHHQDFLRVADELAIPAAFLMGVGRIGNFIDGQIVGSLTDVPWAVKFPDAEGFRHPVVLYDGIKNLMLIPLLLSIRRRQPPRGVVMAHFIFWYAFLRLFVDLFREYPTTLLGLATGQSLNLFMSALGLAMLAWFHHRAPRETPKPADVGNESPIPLWLKAVAFAVLLVFSATMPSDWTQDVPRRYGERHPGLHYSKIYPRIEN